MSQPPPATDLERRGQVRVRLRPNLVVTPHEAAGEPGHVVKDPVSLSYLRLDERQHFLATLMDGSRPLCDIRLAYEARFRPDRLTPEELEDFARQLVQAGLATSDAPDFAAAALGREDRRRGEALLARLLNPLCVRIPVVRPEPWLDYLVPAGRVVFSRWFLALSVVAALGALGLVATHWSELRARLPEGQELFTFRTLVLLWVAVGVVKVLHELGHAVCCRVLGGAVHEMGVLLLFFFPALYCNVSDAWCLPGRWRRVAVAAAGMYVELLVATAATFVWWASADGTVLHQLALALMVVCGVSTLACNLNPLMRLDGYFLLSDALGVPNLAELSGRCLESAVLRWLGVSVCPEPLPARLSAFWLAAFALASHAYRTAVLGGALFVLCGFLESHRLGSLAPVLVGVTALTLLAWPAVRVARSVRARGGLPAIKPARTWLALGALAGAAAVVFVVPVPYHVRARAVVQADPARVHRLTVPESGGFLKHLHVRDGQPVRAGDVLAVLDCPKLQARLQVAEADRALRQQQLAAHVAQRADHPRATEDDADAWQRVSAELVALERQLASLREQSERLVLRAPWDGVVTGLVPPDELGRWFDKGGELGVVSDDQTLRLLAVVGAADRKLIAQGTSAQARLRGAWDAVPGAVAGVAHAEAGNIPPALSHHSGGDVVTRKQAATSAETPVHQNFLVAVRLGESPAVLHPGVVCQVRLDAGSHTLWWRLRRSVALTFGWAG